MKKMGTNLSLVYRISIILYVATIHRIRNSIFLSRSVNPHNLFVLDSGSCFVTLPVCPSITDILQINKAAATPSVTMGTWVLWDAAFSTVWISMGSKSIPCNNVSPERTKRHITKQHGPHFTTQVSAMRQGKESDTHWEGWISQSICQWLSLNCNYEKLNGNPFSPFLTHRIHLKRLSFCSWDAKENANSVTLKGSLQITGSLTSKINVSLREGKQIPGKSWPSASLQTFRS